jgi:hypothetical protein
MNPSLPLSDSFRGRLAAQAILRSQFDMKEAVAELRPDIKQWRSFGQRAPRRTGSATQARNHHVQRRQERAEVPEANVGLADV